MTRLISPTHITHGPAPCPNFLEHVWPPPPPWIYPETIATTQKPRLFKATETNVASVFEKSNFKHIKATTVRTMETMETVEDVSTVPSEVNEWALEPWRGADQRRLALIGLRLRSCCDGNTNMNCLILFVVFVFFGKCGVTILHWNAWRVPTFVINELYKS